MNALLRPFFVVSTVLSLAGCDKPLPPAAAVAPISVETDSQLAEARDALQRQALEIETKTALMDQQLAEMAQALKDRENTELRGSLDALKQQNEALRAQADATRQQSDDLTQRLATTPLPNVVPQPVVQPDYSLFYERLAPYGRWLEVNGYGYCWLPTITVMGWRPYVDGCWVWSTLGWAWQSNEPFGWATYHYGRWLNLAGHGWAWVPGSEWAPAWVAWRQSLDCVGWAPLPPEPGAFSGVYRDCDSRYGLGPTSYTFITTNQFVNTSYINVYAPVTRQTTIYQHSVNVTQIVPRRDHGRAFVNQGGPPRSQMEQACGRPVPQRQVQAMHADQMPAQQHPHGRREAMAPIAMVQLPAIKPGAHLRHPEVSEHIQRPARVSGFEGVPQQVASAIRETITRERAAAIVQQQSVDGRRSHERARPRGELPVLGRVPPVLNPLPQETVRPAITAIPNPERNVEPTQPAAPVAETPSPRSMPSKNRGVHHRSPAVLLPAPSEPPQTPAIIDKQAPEPSVVTAPVQTSEQAAPAVVMTPPATMPQPPVEPSVAPQQSAADTRTAEQDTAHAAADETARVHGNGESAQGTAMQHRQRQEGQARGMAEKRAAEQAAETEKARRQTEAAAMQEGQARAQAENMAVVQATAAAEAEKTRMQAAAQQQVEAVTQQQRMATEQAAAETEKARQLAEAAAMQQQQEQAAQQQRVAAERMAADQAAAAARTQQVQAETAVMQRQQEEVTRRAAEEQQMRTQQEAAQRAAQEMAQRQADEVARRQQEAEMQRTQELAQRQAEEQARRAAEEQMRAQQEAAQRAAQEMAQRQAEEVARRQQEAEMQRAQELAQRQAQEQARRAAEEQMRAQQEAAQRAAQEMAQRQAEEQARRAQEEAQRATAEAAQRAATEATRNQPQPGS